MRIRTQSLLGIVPLFVALGAVIGALVVVLERREITWGLEEEGQSLALSMAAFVRPDELPGVAAPAADEKPSASVAALGRALKWKRALRVAVVTIADGRVLFDSDALEPGASPFWSPADLDALRQGATAATRMDGGKGHGMTATSVAGIRSTDGLPTAAVCVLTDASALTEQWPRGLRKAAVGVGIAFLLGLGCAILSSAVLTERIRVLNEGIARATRLQDAPMLGQQGAIRELNEMGNTFSTMISVMHGTIAKTRRTLLDMEMYRTEEDLAEAFEATYWTPRALVKADMSFIVRLVEGGHRGTFIDLIETPGHIHAVIGRSGEKGSLKATCRASATIHYLRRQLLRRTLGEALEMTALLFDVADLRLVDWAVGADEIVIHRYDRDAEAFQSVRTAINPGENRAVHDLGGDADDRIDIYVKMFPQDSVMTLMDELLLIVRSLDSAPRGAMILVNRQA